MRRLQRAAFLLPAGLCGYLWLKGAHPDLPGWSCPLRSLTGIPCPTCFLSRATSAALRGDLAGSLQLHAFGPLAALALLGWAVLAIQQRRLRPRLGPAAADPRLLAWGGLALLLYWLLRLLLSYGLGQRGFPAFPSG